VNTKTGACVNLDEFRVLNFLEGKSVGYALEKDSYNKFAAAHGFKTNVTNMAATPMVANFRHNGDFWIAQLELSAVKDVYFQVEEFKINVPKEKMADSKLQNIIQSAMATMATHTRNLQPPDFKAQVEGSIQTFLDTGVYTAAHGQLRVDFSQPVLLASHKNPSVRARVSSVVFSIHAVAEGYDPVKGILGDYPLALGIYSGSEKFTFSVVKQRNNFRQYKLNLAQRDVQSLIIAYLKQAESYYRTRDYNTISANCGNIWFETAENAFLASRNPALVERVKKGDATGLGRNYPKYAQYSLQAYGWLANPNDLVGTPWTDAPN
jgi:hypothetical protein